MEQRTMLIVDDLEVNRAVLMSYFSDTFSVLEAENVSEALSILKRQRVDILITDIFMPKMDGIALMQAVRMENSLKNIAIIAITEREENCELRALQAGADDFINKPFSVELLKHRIHSVISQSRFRQNISLHSFPYNDLKLPFAIVRLVEDKVYYHYVNKAYAALSEVTPEQFLQENSHILNPDFAFFLSKTSENGSVSKQTFFYEKKGKYYDVAAYRNQDSFYSFSASENLEIGKRIREKEAHDHILREITTADPNALGILHFNLTKRQCEGGSGSSPYFSNLSFPVECDTLIKKLSTLIVEGDDRKRFCACFSIEALLEKFEKGITQLQESYFAKMANGGIHWLTVLLKIAKNTQTGDVECVAYCVDEMEKKISHLLIETVIKKDYDCLLCIDPTENTLRVFGGKQTENQNTIFSFLDFDIWMKQYLQMHYDGDEKETFIAENSIEAILKRMKNRESMVVDVRLIKNGEVRLERVSYYWMDERKTYLCVTFTNITNSLQLEQERNAELQKLVTKAREEERLHSQERDDLRDLYYEEIRQKELMLTNLLANIPGGIAIYKISEEIETLYSSDGVPKLSGRTMEEYEEWIKEDAILATVHPDDQGMMRREIERVVPLGKPLYMTYRLHHKNGSYLWVMLSAVKIREEDGCPIYYAVYTSIPEQVAQYAELCENSPTAIHVVDMETNKILFANKETRKIAGVDMDISGQTCYKIIHKADKVCDFCCRHRKEYNTFIEKAVVLKNNRYYTAKSKRMDWNGREVCIVYLTDETNFIHSREEVEKLNHAREANIAKTEFLSRISHDMRTPMNGILGLAMLSEDENDIEVLKNDMKQIQISGRYLLNLINDTLDMNQIEAGRLELHPMVCSGGVLFQNLFSNMDALARKKGVQLERHLKDIQWLTIYFDGPRVEQILINLISNAIKYTPKGGKVDFFMSNLPSEEGFVRDQYIIRDTGIGMGVDFLPHLFEPFSRENRINTDREYGTGLGMSIVKKLIELMDGEITVKSEVGKGTEVTVVLQYPVIIGELLSEQISRTDFTELSGKRILLCEDHPLNAKIAVKLLEKKGMLVDWVEDGKLGLEQFIKSKTYHYDAILMDIRMPYMNGLETTKAIRSLDRADGKTIPIIAMTANAFKGDEMKSIAVGMNAHLAKPIDPNYFYQTLSQLIDT